jgi:flagellar hook-associated protein 3 FlgL
MRIKNGNGTFVTAAPVDPLTKISTNTGTGIISSGNVLDPTKWAAAGNNKDFTIKFAVSATVPPVTTYDIIDNVSGNSLLTGAAPGAAPYPRIYTDGSTISLKNQGAEPPFDYGVELSIQGAPATGDTFTVKASTNESIFTTLNDLITTLENANVPTGSTSLTNNLNTALTNFDNDLNQILTVRSSIGARMNEVTAVKNTGQDIALQYQETLSGLQDLDYTKALSEFSLKQIALTAAQKSFVSVQGLSLFNYIQ